MLVHRPPKRPLLSSKWKVLQLYLFVPIILQGKKTTLESNAITLIVRVATRHPRTARSCGSTHGTPTQWTPMTRQLNETSMKTGQASAAQFPSYHAPAPPVETIGMHARLSPSILENHKKNATAVYATHPISGKRPPQSRKL
jgi:hypothetical protein